MASAEFFVKESDTRGGVSASFLVEWVAEQSVSDPLVETVMIGTASTQGVSFAYRGPELLPVIIGEKYNLQTKGRLGCAHKKCLWFHFEESFSFQIRLIKSRHQMRRWIAYNTVTSGTFAAAKSTGFVRPRLLGMLITASGDPNNAAAYWCRVPAKPARQRALLV